jgi:hypothetical protein
MVIANVTEHDIRQAASMVRGIRIDRLTPINTKQTRWRVKLSPYPLTHPRHDRRSEVYNRRTGRYVQTLSWHTFRRFFLALWHLRPDTVIITAYARYDNRSHFYATAQDAWERWAENYQTPDLGY